MLSRIPRTGEADDVAFHFTMGVSLTADGGLYTLDWLNHSIRLFDGRGRLVREFSGKGEGPGQMSEPMQLTVVPGRIYVADPGNRRLTWFSSTGAHVGDRPYPAMEAGRSPYNVFPLRNGLTLIEVQTAFGSTLGPEGRRNTQVVLYDSAGKRLQVVAEYASGASFGYARGRPQIAIPAGDGYFGGGQVAVSGDSLIVIVDAYRGVLRYYTVEKTSARLTRTRQLGWPARPLVLSLKEQQQWKELAANSLGVPAAGVLLSFPEYLAHVSRAQLAPNGDVWLQRAPLVQVRSGLEQEWIVVPFAAGQPLREVRTPKDFLLRSVRGDRIAGVQLDADRVESVVVLRLATAGVKRSRD